MKIEVFRPKCNLDTVRDGRGGIFTWVPKEPIVEFNLIHLREGKIRGAHYHSHFVEYLLIVGGTGVIVTRDRIDDEGCPEEFLQLSPGICIRTPIGVVHTIYAVTEMTFVAMLTREWDKSDPPIVPVTLAMGIPQCE